MGASGRVGSIIADIIEQDPQLHLKCRINSKSDLDHEISLLHDCDVLIDFSNHLALAGLLQKIIDANFNIPVVTGSTGWDDNTLRAIKDYSKNAPILVESNMSLAVNLLFALSEIMAKSLSGKGFSAKISETHHIHKLDSPSGTAIKLFNIINQASPNIAGSIVDIQSTREGEVVGDHCLQFDSNDESISISHFAKNRKIFAAGALTAAKWLMDRGPGLYSMRDVLKGELWKE